MNKRTIFSALATGAAIVGLHSAANAELVLSQVIVDFPPGQAMREDIEVWNAGEERMYVSAEPFQIVGAGTAEERRIALDLGDESGLFVSPRRMVLEPGERRIVRVGATKGRPDTDSVYRLSIKPVAGAVSADRDALKVFVGYDALVLVRPEHLVDEIAAERRDRTLILRNEGNTAQELFDGRQCDARGENCQALPSKRLYPDAEWVQTLPYDTPVTYSAGMGPSIRQRNF
jgi:P pilus assembly chaperone PapD